jgi:predicted O-methyltransferase YrrM
LLQAQGPDAVHAIAEDPEYEGAVPPVSGDPLRYLHRSADDLLRGGLCSADRMIDTVEACLTAHASAHLPSTKKLFDLYCGLKAGAPDERVNRTVLAAADRRGTERNWVFDDLWLQAQRRFPEDCGLYRTRSECRNITADEAAFLFDVVNLLEAGDHRALTQACLALLRQTEAPLVAMAAAANLLLSTSRTRPALFSLRSLREADFELYRLMATLAFQPIQNFAATYRNINWCTGKTLVPPLFRPNGLISPSEIDDLTTLLPETQGLRIVEVGSWAGLGSTRVLIEHAKRYDGLIFCVDAFPEIHLADGCSIDLLEMFKRNVELFEVGDRLTAIRSDSAGAAKNFDDGSVDAVYIDGDHSRQGVLRDLAAWIPKVRPGGIVIGHDCGWRVEDFGRDELAANDGGMAAFLPYLGNRSLERFSLADGKVMIMPGVVLAVDEFFAGDYELGSGGPNGIWYKRL